MMSVANNPLLVSNDIGRVKASGKWCGTPCFRHWPHHCVLWREDKDKVIWLFLIQDITLRMKNSFSFPFSNFSVNVICQKGRPTEVKLPEVIQPASLHSSKDVELWGPEAFISNRAVRLPRWRTTTFCLWDAPASCPRYGLQLQLIKVTQVPKMANN